MMKKRVLVLSNMYPSERSLTFGIFVKNQVEALKERGIDVDVIAVTNPKMGKKNALKKYSLWALQIAWNFLTRGRHYDVVHAHYVFPTGLFALLYKKCFGTRMIVTAHGGDIDKMAKKHERIRRWTMNILQEADHVIAVGHQLYDEIGRDFGVNEAKRSLINMGVNRSVFHSMDRQQAKERCGIKKEEKAILYVGNLIREKGLLELLDAYTKVKQSIPETSLYFIGAVKDERFYEQLLQHIQEKQLTNVHLLPAKPQQEIATWMNAADVFVLPSHIEGFGLVALEAMACGTPVVGTNVGGLKYLLANGAGMLVEAKNSEALAETLIRVLTNEQLANELRKNGEKRAEENDAQHMLDKVLQVYFPTGG
jgi:glycosyltransferase involved in cell wall biosynthesis